MPIKTFNLEMFTPAWRVIEHQDLKKIHLKTLASIMDLYKNVKLWSVLSQKLMCKLKAKKQLVAWLKISKNKTIV